MKISGLILSFLLVFAGRAASMDYQSYSYTQGFEGADPVSFWATNATYTVNALGITTAKAYSGTHSYIFDITINSGTWIYYRIPLSPAVPDEGALNLSGRVWFEQVSGTPAFTLGLDINLYAPNSLVDYPIGAAVTPAAQWSLLNYDAVAAGNYCAAHHANPIYGYMWGATAANIGRRVGQLGFFIVGQAGDRIRVYLDDLQLAGSVPTVAGYITEITNKWAPYDTRFDARMSELNSGYSAAQSAINNLPGDLTAFEEELATRAQALLNYVNTYYNLTAIAATGFFEENPDVISYRIKQASGICNGISLARNDDIIQETHLLYNVPPTVGNFRFILPNPANNYIPADINHEILITTTPGEYEPASFAVEAFTALNDLTVAITDLVCNENTIPESAIDIRVVKCWYQNGIDTVGYSVDRKLLVPELLLKDDSLVSINTSTQDNYVKLDGDYVWTSDPDDERGCPANDEFPVEDSAALQPVDIASGSFKQFWITVHAPSDTPAGEYTGYLTLSTPTDGTIGKYPVTVNVLSFELEDYVKNSLYYRGTLSAAGHIGSEYKNSTQYANEIADMIRHGGKNPSVYDPPATLGNALAARQSAGVDSDTLYYLGHLNDFSISDFLNADTTVLQNLKNEVTSVRNTAASYGIGDVYFYVVDEAQGESVLRQREAWEAVHEAGGKVFSAGYEGSLALQYPWGKVGSWHLDENTGAATVIDSSGYGNTGTVTNGTVLGASGKIGAAATFDGTNDYINCGSGTSLDRGFGNGITLEAWIKPEAPNGAYQYIMLFDSGYYLARDPNRKILGRFYNGSAWRTMHISSSTVPDGDWAHVAWTFDGTTARIYINGTQNYTSTADSGYTVTPDQAQNLGISKYWNTFKGSMDEVRIYNRALRSDEIAKNYQDGVNGKWTTVGDLKDLHTLASALCTYEQTEVDTCHEVAGHEIFSYGNPQCGVENPQVYRQNYGLRLWRYGYDGSMDYAYQHSFGFGWNDFDDTDYRDHNFTYPTVTGVIDTIAWEGFREGIDDLRYIATLEKVISETPSCTEKDDAVAFVNNLKLTTGHEYDCWISDDLESYIRGEIIEQILILLSL